MGREGGGGERGRRWEGREGKGEDGGGGRGREKEEGKRGRGRRREGEGERREERQPVSPVVDSHCPESRVGCW